MGRGLNLGGLAHWLVRLPAALRADEVRGEDGVNERRLSEARLACNSSVRQYAASHYAIK